MRDRVLTWGFGCRLVSVILLLCCAGGLTTWGGVHLGWAAAAAFVASGL